ncbi:hypothetical protein C0J52_05771 [Blattella germanica]|nr:hypothetical protein C0J52_05771 [Blattella germanica]
MRITQFTNGLYLRFYTRKSVIYIKKRLLVFLILNCLLLLQVKYNNCEEIRK